MDLGSLPSARKVVRSSAEIFSSASVCRLLALVPVSPDLPLDSLANLRSALRCSQTNPQSIRYTDQEVLFDISSQQVVCVIALNNFHFDPLFCNAATSSEFCTIQGHLSIHLCHRRHQPSLNSHILTTRPWTGQICSQSVFCLNSASSTWKALFGLVTSRQLVHFHSPFLVDSRKRSDLVVLKSS